MKEAQTKESKRVVSAPAVCGADASSGVISILLGDDEDVQWHWTHYPGGGSVVTGYEIIKKERVVDEEEFSFNKAVADLLWPEMKNQDGDSDHVQTPAGPLNRARKTVGFLSSIDQRD